MDDDGQPLHDAHDEVDHRTHVVGGEAADEVIELVRRRADPEQERHLDEEDDECCCTARI